MFYTFNKKLLLFGISQACKVTQSFNCVTDIIRENFEFVENLRIINPKDCPLYGLPVSIKESFGLKVTCLFLVEPKEI